MSDEINREQGDGNGHDSGHSLPLIVGRLKCFRDHPEDFGPDTISDAFAEAVAALEEANERVGYAEILLDRLATGFWHHTLNENSPGENVGDMVLDYWRRWNGEIPPPRNLSSNAKAHGMRADQGDKQQ